MHALHCSNSPDRRIKLRSEDTRVDYRHRMSSRERGEVNDKSVISGGARVTSSIGQNSRLLKVNARSRAGIDLSRRAR